MSAIEERTGVPGTSTIFILLLLSTDYYLEHPLGHIFDV